MGSYCKFYIYFKAEVTHLQKENRTLRCEDGAIGGPNVVPNVDMQANRFAHELRTAASTAEHSLRLEYLIFFFQYELFLFQIYH